MHAGAEWFGLTLEGTGYGEELHPVAAAGPTATNNRVEYRRAGLTEWYVNGPLGLEQGFTLAAPPAQKTSDPLTLALRLSGTLHASRAPGATDLELALEGRPVSLRYRGLAAWDASGQALPARLELEGRTLFLRVDDAGARYPVTIDPFLEQAKLTASDGAAGDRLGFGVAVSGDTVVVGARVDDVGANADQGSAYVFVKPATGWASATETAKLTASDGAAGDQFGSWVAVSGDTVVVGAVFDDVGVNANQGSAYVFVKQGTGWASATETAKLTASDGAAGDVLGFVAVSGDTVVVGAQGDNVGANADQGSAYVFVKPGTGWASATETAKLTASDGAAGDGVGITVAVSDDTVVVGAHGDDVGTNTSQGSAYVFVKPATGWASATETAKLTASDGAAGDAFGSVAVSGDTVVVGAQHDDVSANANQGSAYVFVKPGTGWASATETAKLTASDGAADDFFGALVAVSGDTVVVGAVFAAGGVANQGSAYVFGKPGTGWASATETAKLTASDGAADDFFGLVAVSGDTVVVGAQGNDVGANADQGSVYVFVNQPDDATAPTTTIALAPATPDGQSGWYVSDVQVTVTAADDADGSGVAETRCVLDPVSAPATFDDIPAGCPFTGAGDEVTADGGHTVYAASKDVAGNEETPVGASFKIDQTDPTVTCDVASPGPVFLLLGSGGNVSATVTDATSGPEPGSEVAGANVATVGNKSVSLIGDDEAGNSTSASCPYRVSYRFVGFQNLKSSYKQNQTIPVKLMLADAAGMAIPDADAQALLTPCRVKVTLDAVEQVGCASYNASTNTFQYNLKTSKSLAVGPHALAIKVSAPDGSGVVNADGTTITITN